VEGEAPPINETWMELVEEFGAFLVLNHAV